MAKLSNDSQASLLNHFSKDKELITIYIVILLGTNLHNIKHTNNRKE